jgi:hypothetical protein
MAVRIALAGVAAEIAVAGTGGLFSAGLRNWFGSAQAEVPLLRAVRPLAGVRRPGSVNMGSGSAWR